MGIGLRVRANNQKFLKKYVLEEGLCTGCGACVGLCPYQVIYHDRTMQLHDCDLEDGKCYAFCPRTATDLAVLRELLFEKDDLTPEIGAVKGYYFSQATDPKLRKIAQHGATVTSTARVPTTLSWLPRRRTRPPQGGRSHRRCSGSDCWYSSPRC